MIGTCRLWVHARDTVDSMRLTSVHLGQVHDGVDAVEVGDVDATAVEEDVDDAGVFLASRSFLISFR